MIAHLSTLLLLTELLGRIGDIDLDDVHSAAKAVIHEHGGGRIDGGKVGLFGGSHGGFITAFLVGMYPDFYQAGVLRNPVINVGRFSLSLSTYHPPSSSHSPSFKVPW